MDATRARLDEFLENYPEFNDLLSDIVRKGEAEITKERDEEKTKKVG